jgi:SPX domain protein involved in polyphosphate accumulation
MKFAEHLWTHLTPEWYSQYIAYDNMKEMLTKWVAKAQQLPDANDILAREQIFLYADEQFFRVRTQCFT